MSVEMDLIDKLASYQDEWVEEIACIEPGEINEAIDELERIKGEIDTWLFTAKVWRILDDN